MWLAVTCHLHFRQNGQDILRAPAVTLFWNGYRTKSQHRKLTLEKKILPPLLPDSNLGPFDHESGALTTELSPLLNTINKIRVPLLISAPADVHFFILPLTILTASF